MKYENIIGLFDDKDKFKKSSDFLRELDNYEIHI